MAFNNQFIGIYPFILQVFIFIIDPEISYNTTIVLNMSHDFPSIFHLPVKI
jgi:hypothetical protein